MALYQGSMKVLLIKDENSGMFYLHSKRIEMPEEECAVTEVFTAQNQQNQRNQQRQEAESQPHVIPDDQEQKSVPKKKKERSVDINEAHDKMGHVHEQVIRETCKDMKVKLTGEFKPCEACMKAKAKAKAVKKTTEHRATKIGERLYLDTSGPFAPSMRGSRYWGKICDQYSGKTWDRFLTN